MNDVVSCTSSLIDCGNLSLFADDLKVYSTEENNLQMTLNSICQWLRERQLKLAPHKCSVISIKKATTSLNDATFSLENVSLPSSNTIKDLGVFISSDLKWAKHIDSLYKSTSTISYRILKSFKTTNIWTLLKLYTTYVRPKLEFNSCVWSPYLKTDIIRIESIQRSFTRKAFLRCNIHFSSYKNRLYQLGIKSLQYRRLTFDLILIYKIIHGLSDIKFDDYFSFQQNIYVLRGNSRKIKLRSDFKMQATLQVRHCFFMRSTKYWNLLPDHIAKSSNIVNFKRNLLSFDLHDLFPELNLIFL